MSYTVLALKWRPQNFDEIVGQSHISGTLKNTLQKDRLAHAYLFAGPRGVGKTSTARILAKSLNCKEGPTVTPCGKCNSCLDITKGNSLDVMEIDGASNRQIDDIRTLRENVKFAPTLGKFKIYIIDEVHMLTNEAFNALLKTLEEPPPFVKFIFATTHPHKVPLTILSRCQRLDFRRIPVMETVAQLNKIVKAENIHIDKDVLFAIAKSSDGSLRDAESILDQLASFAGNNVSLKDAVSVLGLIEQEVLFEITNKIMIKDAKGALELLNGIIDDGKDISVFLANLIEHFRNLMIAKITHADPKLIDLPPEICEKLLTQSQALSLEDILSSFNILVAAQEMGKRIESLRVALEISLVRLAQNKKDLNMSHAPVVKPIIEKKETKPFHEVKQAPVKEKAPVVTHATNKMEEPLSLPKIFEEPQSSITLDEIKAVWQNTIDALAKIKMSVSSYFNEGAPVKWDKNILTISFPKDYSLHKESLERRENRELIEKTLSGLLKCNIRAYFILSQEASAVKEKQDNPLIKSAVETFSGRVIKKE